jgi:hypothetical protein
MSPSGYRCQAWRDASHLIQWPSTGKAMPGIFCQPSQLAKTLSLEICVFHYIATPNQANADADARVQTSHISYALAALNSNRDSMN